MNPSRVCVCLILLFAMAASGSGQDSWKKVENPSFSFSIPSFLKKTQARGKDSFVEQYAADNIRVSFDFGIYSNNFQDWPEHTRFEKLIINGKPARIGTVKHEFHKGYPYSTQVFIKLKPSVALSMYAACKSEQDVLLAQKIFKTLQFNEKQASVSLGD